MSQLHELTDQYLEALLRRDPNAAAAVVVEGLQRGWSAARLYLKVLAEAQVQIGEMWHSGQINVAQEHLATQITLDQMEQLRQRFQPSSKRGYRVVVACVEGNRHWVGARMVADLLGFDGWDVVFLGEDTPSPDLLEFVRQTHPGLVALSVSMEEHLAKAEQAITDLHRLPNPPQVLVGGCCIRENPGVVLALGADGVGGDAVVAIQEVQRLLGLAREPMGLSDYLIVLGQRVQELRKGRSWSQEQLAQTAGLDRTYISAVEHGKQNLTLGAVVKLADALEVPLGYLFAGRSSQS